MLHSEFCYQSGDMGRTQQLLWWRTVRFLGTNKTPYDFTETTNLTLYLEPKIA